MKNLDNLWILMVYYDSSLWHMLFRSKEEAQQGLLDNTIETFELDGKIDVSGSLDDAINNLDDWIWNECDSDFGYKIEKLNTIGLE